ncbi:MAG: HD domain-containing protein [Candidatus Methanodesulfokora sp.]
MNVEFPEADLILPIWGEVRIPRPLCQIYFLPVIQRLSEIKQLALTDSKYSGGNHTRLEHSLGVLSVTEKILDNLGRSGSLKPVDTTIIKLGALLHDIGHGGWGHSLDGLHGYVLSLLRRTNPDAEIPSADKLDIAIAWYLLKENDQLRAGLRKIAEELGIEITELENAVSLMIAEEPGLIEHVRDDLRQAVLYGQTILGEPRGVGGVNADRILLNSKFN